jgi:prepilin-type N-terminal cleavage/methylation domain-containing protein
MVSGAFLTCALNIFVPCYFFLKQLSYLSYTNKSFLSVQAGRGWEQKLILLNNSIRVKSLARHEEGFSLIELIIVMLVISILAVLSMMSFKSEKKHAVDREALIVMDLLNEAKQRALTQHETMRIELNKTKNTITLITENTAGNAGDDQIIKSLPLQHQNYITFEKAPTNTSNTPVDSAPVPAVTFSASTHPLSLSDQVATLRFTQTGTVFNAGSNSVGTNATSTGADHLFLAA